MFCFFKRQQKGKEKINKNDGADLKNNDIVNSIQKTLKSLHGSFALGIIFKDQPNIIVGARRGSPLAVGYGPNENYLGSDSYALKSMTNKITYLDDGEFCVIKKDHVEFFNEDGTKTVSYTHLTLPTR